MVSILVTLSNSEQSDYKNDKQCCQQYHNDDRIGLVLYIPVTELITHYLLKYNCQMDLQKDQHDKTTDILETHYDFHDSEMIKLEIKSSNLPGSGMGLFASQLISQNQIIAEYYGSVMRTINSNDKEFAHQDKMIQVDNQVCVISRGPASRANDTVKWQPQNYNSVLFKMLRQKSSFPKHKEHTINATISINSKQKAFLKAARPIKPGQQIFIQYGFDYWDFFYKLKLGLHSE